MKKVLRSVDLVGAKDRSGLPPRTHTIPFGDVLLAPVEFLIVRRLMRASRERSTELFRQAEVLAAQYKRSLDWDYIRVESGYEKVSPLFKQLKAQVLARRRRPR